VTTTVLQAYRFALDPAPAQEAALRSHCGAQRSAVNWGLALVSAVMNQRTAEASYGIPAAEMTPSLSWSAYSLRKTWNQTKSTVAGVVGGKLQGGVLLGPGEPRDRAG
jgi:putative transposase